MQSNNIQYLQRNTGRQKYHTEKSGITRRTTVTALSRHNAIYSHVGTFICFTDKQSRRLKSLARSTNVSKLQQHSKHHTHHKIYSKIPNTGGGVDNSPNTASRRRRLPDAEDWGLDDRQWTTGRPASYNRTGCPSATHGSNFGEGLRHWSTTGTDTECHRNSGKHHRHVRTHRNTPRTPPETQRLLRTQPNLTGPLRTAPNRH